MYNGNDERQCFMKNGRAVYRIDRYIDMDDEKVLFGDGSHILYVNGEYRGDDDMGKLTLTEIPIYFQELSKEDIKEIELTVKPVLQQA